MVTGVKGIPEVTIREVMSGEFDLMVGIKAAHSAGSHGLEANCSHA